MTCGFVIQLVFCKKKICGLLEETSAPPPKKILDPPLSGEGKGPRPVLRIQRGGVETWMWSVVRGVGL